MSKIYHYTSPEGCYSILKNKTLRFCDYRFMNDRTESNHFLNLTVNNIVGYPTLIQKEKETLTSLIAERDIWKGYIENEGEHPTLTLTNDKKYLFCSSLEEDDLSLWNYYIHNNQYQGYSIGLKEEQLLANLNDVDGLRAYSKKVVYASEIQNLIEEKIRRYLKETDEPSSFEASFFWAEIYRDSLFYKNLKFENENEYRIVLEIQSNMKSEFIERGNLMRGGIIVPYIDVKLKMEDLVDSLTIAPIMDEEIARLGLEEFIESNTEYNFKINKSIIPIRY